MTEPSDILKALARRSHASPDVTALETEIRSQGAPHFKSDPSPGLCDKLSIIASWEWNYGVPLSDIADFIAFLRDHELRIFERIGQLLPQPGEKQIDYGGTFISASGERGWYECRTVWSYRGNSPVPQWSRLLADGEFNGLFRQLRKRWARDPTANERLMSLLGLYNFDADFIDQDSTAIQQAQQAIMAATIDYQ